MPIIRLPTLLVNQIAAGEVIERPASVVKELVDNSLDSGATRIDIAIENGGADLIRISDNGSGIPKEELELAVTAHATSKLTSAEQLEAIGTLGFRGEALASIASVSRLEITSVAAVDGKLSQDGASIEASGEKISEIKPASAAPGTITQVRDLFFNTPARRKFMRQAGTEIGHISQAVQRIAICQPQVSFTLTHNSRKVLELLATGESKKRCIDILGKDIEEGMLEFQSQGKDSATNVWGLAGQPSLCKSTGKAIYVCLNGRPIRDRNLIHAVREAYRGLIAPGKYPVLIALINMPAEDVDVNVHPTKSEVRFFKPGQIHGLLLSAIRQRLLGADLTPSAQVVQEKPAGFKFNASPKTVDTNSYSSELAQEQSDSGFAPQADNKESLSADSFVNYFKQMQPKQKGFIYEQVKQAYDNETPLLQANSNNGAGALDNEAEAQKTTLRQQSILQIHDSYVVTQDSQGILIVDQHALHERVMFEQLFNRLLKNKKSLESQRLLMPQTLPADQQRLDTLDKLGPLLKRIGIEAAPIGPKSIGIQAFATFLFDRNVEPVEFLDELLDKAQDGEIYIDVQDISSENVNTTEEAALHKIIDMMSCKAAVKAGDKLTEAEIASLLEKREQVERSSNCPHGRPTTIRLSMRDLAKQFKRE